MGENQVRKKIFSSARESPTIQLGDTVIAYVGRDSLIPVTVTNGQILMNKFGRFPHDAMIGKPWGSVLRSAPRPSDGFIHLLRPTPALWTESLTHRTQILYLPDISFITSYLDIKPGSKVVEAGTGSGSFSHALACTIGESGRLYTFEFHQERYKAAKEEFENHGLDQVKLEHRNVCKDGFGITEEVSAVFLDLPSPWDAIPFAKQAFRKDILGRICCFSPCIEQVLKTVTTLSSYGFTDVVTYEISMRDHLLTTQELPDVQSAFDRLWAVQKKKEVRREWQIEQTKIEREKKRKREEEEIDEARKKRVMESGGAVTVDDTIENTRKEIAEEVQTSVTPETLVDSAKNKEGQEMNKTSTHTNGKNKSRPTDLVYRAQGFLKGHTSFLTFAFHRPSLTAAFKKVGEDMDEVPFEFQVDQDAQMEGEDAGEKASVKLEEQIIKNGGGADF